MSVDARQIKKIKAATSVRPSHHLTNGIISLPPLHVLFNRATVNILAPLLVFSSVGIVCCSGESDAYMFSFHSRHHSKPML